MSYYDKQPNLSEEETSTRKRRLIMGIGAAVAAGLALLGAHEVISHEDKDTSLGTTVEISPEAAIKYQNNMLDGMLSRIADLEAQETSVVTGESSLTLDSKDLGVHREITATLSSDGELQVDHTMSPLEGDTSSVVFTAGSEIAFPLDEPAVEALRNDFSVETLKDTLKENVGSPISSFHYSDFYPDASTKIKFVNTPEESSVNLIHSTNDTENPTYVESSEEEVVTTLENINK